MRITSNTVHQRVRLDLQRQLGAVDEAHQKVTSGLRIRTPADDPAGASDIMGADTRLRALTQYRRNVEVARSRLSAEEGVLDQLTEITSRARELAVGQGTDTANAATRAVTRAEVDQLRAAVVQLGNTHFAGSFLFGGVHADAPPLNADGSLAHTDGGATAAAAGVGQHIPATHAAAEIFTATGITAALADLSTALADNDAAGIRAGAGALSNVLDRLQDLMGEVGARSNRMDSAVANIDALSINVRAYRAGVAEADFEAAITELVTRQTALQAALAATSRILSTNLTDYLR